VEKWVELINHFPPKLFNTIFEKVCPTKDINIVNHFLETLNALQHSDNKQVQSFALAHIQQLPNYLSTVELNTIYEQRSFYYTKDTSRRDTIHKIIEKIFLISPTQAKNATWLTQITEVLTKKMPRNYVNEVLYPILSHLLHGKEQCQKQ